MKKILSIFVVALVFGSLAFADDAAKAGITVSGWGRAIWAPVTDANFTGGSGVGMAIGTSWGGNPRIGFTIAGNSDNVGFVAHIGVDNNQFSITDDTQAWIKPLPGLMLQVGRAFNDTLRGEADFGSYDWIRTQWVGDDVTFKRIGGLAGGAPGPQNAILSYTIGGLFVFVEAAQQDASTKLVSTAIVGGNGGNPYTLPNTANPQAWTTWTGIGTNDANGIWNNLSLGAGYTIDGVGTIRVQKIGYADNGSTNTGLLQAAFKLTGIKGFYADVGFAMPINGDTSGAVANSAAALAGYTFQIPVYLKVSIDKATIHGLFILQSLCDAAANATNIAWDAGLGFDYDLGDGFGINSDVRYGNQYFGSQAAAATAANGDLSFLVGLTKGFSNGMIGIGVQYVTGSFVAMNQGYSGLSGHWAVPVRFEYWF